MRKLKFSKEERRALIADKGEPVIQVLDYRMSLIYALNAYNTDYESKLKVKWARDYAKSLGITITHVPDAYLSGTIGAMSRLIQRQQPIEEQDIESTVGQLKNLAVQFPLPKVVANPSGIPPRPKKDVETVADEIATDIINEIEEAIDSLLSADTSTSFQFDSKQLLKRYSNAKALKIAKEHIEKLLSEFEEVKSTKDKDLIEGYSNITRRKLNALLKMLEESRASLSTQVAVSKVRKPRVVKQKPASVIVAKLKYKKEDTDLSVKSVDVKTIVGASEVVVFNTKYRKLTILRALDGMTLTVKGTTIINTDPEKSVSKTLRKPQEQLKDFVGASKRTLATNFKAIKSAERLANGRINEDCLIIGVNK